MLPPIQISQNNVAYQIRNTGDVDSGRAPTPPAAAVDAENLGLDVRSAIAGRVSILLLSGPERTTESFTIMAELFGRSLGIVRRENETQVDYMRRLAAALHTLPQVKLQIVEQQLSQLFNGLALKTVIGAFADPAGPDAAIMTMHLEVAGDADAHTSTRFAFANCQPDSEDAKVPAQVARAITLAQAGQDIGPMHLRIVASSVSPGVQHGGTGTGSPAPTSRTATDIRGISDTASAALASTVLADSGSAHAARGIPRTATQVTVDITARTRVEDVEDQQAPQLRRSVSDGDWRQHVQPKTTNEPVETGERTTNTNREHPSVNRRNAVHLAEPLGGRTDIASGTQPVLPTNPQPAPLVESEADDAIGKFLRASLAASQITTQSGPEEQQAWRDSGTIPFGISDPDPSNPAGEQRAEPVTQPRSDAALAKRAARSSLQDSEIPARPEIGQAFLPREPVGFPAVGYPYSDEEENGRRPARRFNEDRDEHQQDDGEDASGQQDMSGGQNEEGDLSRDEDGPEASIQVAEPEITPPQRGISDNANDLYWKMAGWA